jgi:TonB family protein
VESFDQQLYRGWHEAKAMKRILVLFTLLCATLTAHAVSTSTPSVQNVRFAQEISPTDLVLPPQVLTHPAAVYTDEAQKLGIQGNVVVQAYFDADGNVTVLKVVKGLGYGLDENALAVLKGWRFAPALRDGLPVSAVAEIEIPFNIENEKLRQVHLELQRMHQDLERVRQNLEQAIRLRDQVKQTGGQK